MAFVLMHMLLLVVLNLAQFYILTKFKILVASFLYRYDRFLIMVFVNYLTKA